MIEGFDSDYWRNIKGVRKDYYVSSIGEVMSMCSGRPFIMKSSPLPTGYMRVTLRDNDGKAVSFFVHRLVAIAWVLNPDNKPEVNHYNGNKEDNTSENLEWVTPKENIAHARKAGLIVPIKGSAHWNSKLNEGKVKEIKKILRKKKSGEIKITQNQIADMFGTTRGTIEGISSGLVWKHVSIEG